MGSLPRILHQALDRVQKALVKCRTFVRDLLPVERTRVNAEMLAMTKELYQNQ
jgi:hypothetical protein